MKHIQFFNKPLFIVICSFSSLVYPMKTALLALDWYNQKIAQEEWQELDKKIVRTPNDQYKIFQIKEGAYGYTQNRFSLCKKNEEKVILKSEGYDQSFGKFALSLLGTYAILQINEKHRMNGLVVCNTRLENTGARIGWVAKNALDVQAVACADKRAYAACIIAGKDRGIWQDEVFVSEDKYDNLLVLINFKRNQIFPFSLGEGSLKNCSLLFDKEEKNIAFKDESGFYKTYSLKTIKQKTTAHEETHLSICGISIY